MTTAIERLAAALLQALTRLTPAHALSDLPGGSERSRDRASVVAHLPRVERPWQRDR